MIKFPKMKKLLFTILSICSTIVFGQVQSQTINIVTHYVVVETMSWNELSGDWVYSPKVSQTRKSGNWSVNLKSDRSGLVTMEDLGDGDNYYLEVYAWRNETISDRGSIIADFVQRSDGAKGTIIFQTSNGMYGISIFLPSSETYLYFSTIN